MNLGAARLATEKAVFRPALPLSVLPEFTGEHMAKKLTYSEQIKHPLWQRKRLEMLEAAGFECSNCGDKEKTLHVHHKRYVKGRMAWEYERDDLEVLCEDCHEHEHQTRELLDQLIAESTEAWGTTALVGIIAGYLDGECAISNELAQKAIKLDGYSYDLGMFASFVGGAEWSSMAKAARLLASRLTPAQQAALDRWSETAKKEDGATE